MMVDSGRPIKSPATSGDRVVVLVLPELLDGVADSARLAATLAGPSTKAVRVLLCLTEANGQPLATALENLKIETEILLGPKVDAPTTTAFVLRAHPSTSCRQQKEQKEFALSLSDIVLVRSETRQDSVISAATELGKPRAVLGAPLPDIPSLASVHHRLDPDLPGWRACGRRGFGRLEQAIMELLAYNWLGGREGVTESRKRLKKCFGGAWRPQPYFAPPGWERSAPDAKARDPSSRIVAEFDALDRSALHGSYIHRDLVWIEHLGAAFAVLAAVAGQLSGDSIGWGVAELVTLVTVALLVLGARNAALQDRWTACRYGAEQLRIARMSLPLLVLPPALRTPDTPPIGGSHGSKETELGFLMLAQVKRVVRDHGLPRLDASFTPTQAADWLHTIVDDQITYHRNNYRKLECAERRLRYATQMIFVAAVAAVVVHFFIDARWLLLFTAAAPALAAALHGTGTRLGNVHREALSSDAESKLMQIDKARADLMAALPPVDDAWRELRRLAFEAAQAMGLETTSWHGLVRRYRDDLP